MDCNLLQPRKPDALLEREIARLDAIMYCCRRKFGDGGPYLFGRFSIADAFMTPFAIALQSYSGELSQKSLQYRDTLLANPHLLVWMDEARGEHSDELYALTG